MCGGGNVEKEARGGGKLSTWPRRVFVQGSCGGAAFLFGRLWCLYVFVLKPNVRTARHTRSDGQLNGHGVFSVQQGNDPLVELHGHLWVGRQKPRILFFVWVLRSLRYLIGCCNIRGKIGRFGYGIAGPTALKCL